MHLVSRIEGAARTAHQHPETGLLEDVYVVVVGVAHRPPGPVPPRLLAVGPVHEAAVAVSPFLEGVVTGHLGKHKSQSGYAYVTDNAGKNLFYAWF